MLHSFTCKNFYSFKDSATVDFVVNNNAPNDNGFTKGDSGTRISKIETVIGANASGKTHLLKVLPFLKWLIIDSYKLDPTDPIFVQPFKFVSKKIPPTELIAEFEIEGVIYRYAFVLNNERILKEKLSFKSKTLNKVTSKTAFSREWDSKKNEYSFKAYKYKFPKEFSNVLRNNTSVIASAIRLNHKDSQKIARFWYQIASNVIEIGWIGDNMFGITNSTFSESLEFFSENQDYKKDAEKILCRFDFGLDSLDIKKIKKEDGSINIEAKASHIIRGEKHNLNLLYESSGTKQLLGLLKPILVVLKQGGLAVLDEIDVNLHSEIVMAIIDLFIHPETNPHNAQILFSTHSHIVMSKLNKYQLVLVEKDSNAESKSIRLDKLESKNVRTDDNYYMKYISGTYGAYPEIM